MFNWSDAGNVIWSFFWILAFFAYLMALISVVGDLFRDHELTGWSKAVWILFNVRAGPHRVGVPRRTGARHAGTR